MAGLVPGMTSLQIGANRGKFAVAFRALVNRVDEIQDAYALTGDSDYLLKVVLRDLKSLSDIVNNVLMPHQSVAHVRSSIVLDRLKESARLPLKEIKPG